MPKQKSRLRELIVIAIILKVALLIVIYLAAHLLPFCYECYANDLSNLVVRHWSPWLSFGTWDARHYTFLADIGYQGNVPSDAFYPLFPILTFFVSIIIPNTLIAGYIVSNAASLLALALLFSFVKKQWGETVAFNTGLLMLLFPTSYYFTLMYSESLFLALVLAVFYFWDKDERLGAMMCAFLLALSRPLGILMLVPVLIDALGKLLAKTRNSMRVGTDLVIALGCLAGFGAYLLFMYSNTGSLWSGFDAQQYFLAENSTTNLFHPIEWFQRNFMNIELSLHGFTNSIIDRIFLVAYLIALYFIRCLEDKRLFWYALAMGAVPALSGMIMAYTRYLIVVFPIFIVLALLAKKRVLYVAIPCFALQILFLIMHALNFWVA